MTMLKRVVVVWAVAAVLFGAACGVRPLNEQQVCGDAGCDQCIGLGCGQTDGGADAGP
ncbi:MAG: hypothetical protein U0228_10450 [Myxococcaceae bacterium]